MKKVLYCKHDKQCHEKTCFLAYAKTKARISCKVALFVADLVGNPEDRFSHDAAHLV